MRRNPLLELKSLGQSIWLDYIQRGMLQDGTVRRLIEEDGVAGMTSNPAIFERAISGSDDYAAAIAQLARSGTPAAQIYERLTLEDVRSAADLFRNLYESGAARDGFVSLEISPHLAQDTQASISEAQRLWKLLDRPNVMIKVPGTRAGLPAAEALIADGVNVNVTLLFSLERYRDVAQSYIAGLEARIRKGQPVDRIASVASFFLSRIDTLVDHLLDHIIKSGLEQTGQARALRGRCAIASARLAYQIYKELFSGPRWEALAQCGARPQRLLWASTGTKDPSYSKIKYVDALIGADTVNTLPLETVEAYRESGDPRVRLEDDIQQSHEVLNALGALKINLAAVTQQLEEEGVRKFIEPYDKLLATLEQHRLAATG